MKIKAKITVLVIALLFVSASIGVYNVHRSHQYFQHYLGENTLTKDTFLFTVVSALVVFIVLSVIAVLVIPKMLKPRNKIPEIMGVPTTNYKELGEKKENSSMQLESDIAQLKEENTELKAFIYKAAHDLKGPMCTIEGIVNMALRNTDNNSNEKYYQMILDSANRQNSILNELKEVALIQQGEVVLKAINFDAFCEDLLASFTNHPNFLKGSITVNCEFNEFIIADENLLKIVLRNLVENSLKHSCKNNKIEIKITGKKEQENILISTIDNGQGIKKEHQNNIFNMFYRATEKTEGSGLGLYIVKNAVEKMNGSVKVISDIGKGSQFTIYLPILKINSNEEKAAFVS